MAEFILFIFLRICMHNFGMLRESDFEKIRNAKFCVLKCVVKIFKIYIIMWSYTWQKV